VSTTDNGLSDLVPSLVRTWVPVVVGGFISWAATQGIQISTGAQGALIVVLTSAIIAVYYTVVRLLEQKWPAAGLFLGSATQPSYNAPSAPGSPAAVPPPREPPTGP
jgi:hypothetical protein